MKILVIGAGMYVTGRNETGNATVLASLCELSKKITIKKVTVVAKSPQNSEMVLSTVKQLNDKIDSNLNVEYRPVKTPIDSAISKIQSRGEFDCAIVAVPDHLHYPFARVLLQNKIHCLIVKPFATTLREALDLTRLQEIHQVYGAVEFHKRYDESNLYARQIIREKLLGQLLYMTINYSQRISIPSEVFKNWASNSNIFQYLAVHYVDLFYFLTGYLPFKSMAVGTEGVLKKMGLNTYDSVHAMVLWQDPENPKQPFVSQFTTNWIDPNCTSAMSDQSYLIVGTKGRIDLDQKNRGVEMVTARDGIQTVNPYFSEFLSDPDGRLSFNGYGYKSIERFILDVRNILNQKIKPNSLNNRRPSFRQALVSTAVLEAVNISLENDGEWSEINVDF